VSTNPVQNYTIDVYRIGWYQGLGGRLMQHIGPLTGVPQTICPTDSTTGMIECHWSPGYTLTIDSSWTSGIYLARLTNAQNYQNYIMFALRDDRRSAALLYKQPVTTYQAYNDYPYDSRTGKSLYSFNSYGAATVSGSPAAVKVSFDRPYLGDGTGLDWGNSVFSWEINFIRWMEKSGYDVTYSTDVDIHRDGGRLSNYRGVLSVGHDEYWSKPMYDAMVAARDVGVNLAFFAGDESYWQVRFEPSSSGVPNRVMVCYRTATLDPVPDTSTKTVAWRDAPLNRPEQTLVGVQFTNQLRWNPQTNGYVPYVVTNSGNWVYAGTGFKDGDNVPGIVGYEADRSFSQYPPPTAVTGSYTLLSHSPFVSTSNTSDYANSSIYQAPSGAWVFGAGTISWSWALDNFNGGNVVDPRIQQTTANILNRFLGPDFALSASPSSGTVTQGGSTTYSVAINPAGGFADQVTLSVNGLPGGANGSFTPNPATASSVLSVTTSASTPIGSYTLTITGASGALTHTQSVALVVSPPPDFTLSGAPSSRNVGQGDSTSYNVTTSPTGGFAGQVTLSVSGLPDGANGSFTPNPATASSVLTVTTSTSTATGSYTLTITGVSGTLTHTTMVTLVVTPPDFTLIASPASQTVTQGGSTSYGVTISPTGGFSAQVTLSVSGLPNGATGSFSPNPATVSSTLSVTTSTSTPAGTSTITLTGISGGLTHTTTVSLTVARPGITIDNKASSGFQWNVTTASTPPITIGSGTNRAAMIMVTMSGNTATNIAARLGGVNGTVIPGTDSGTTASIRTLIFQVINPPSGPQTATVSWTNGVMNADIGVVTVSGADQSTPCTNGTFAATNSAPGQATSVTIVSNPGDLTASVAFTANTWVTPPTNQMLVWGIDGAAVGGDIGPGTGTTTHTWTGQYANETHAVSGANFKASAQ
jgi:uncharacterized membrane protein